MQGRSANGVMTVDIGPVVEAGLYDINTIDGGGDHEHGLPGFGEGYV